jgi:nucleoside transporter
MTDESNTEAGTGQFAERTPFPLKVRLYVMMFLQYFIEGCFLPIISVYLQDSLGFNAKELGLFGAALAVGPLVAPFIIGQLVDRHFATERVLSCCHLVGGGILLALYFQTAFWPALILGTIYSTLYVPAMMLTNSLTFHHLKDRDREFPAIRLWGTIGFIVPAWLVELYFLKGLTGAELNTGRGVVLALAGIGALVMGIYSLTLPHTPPKRDAESKLAPGKVIGLLRFRHFLVLVLISFLIAIVHKFYFVWNSPYLSMILKRGDILGAWEQRIASIGQIFEVVVMAFLGFTVKRFGFKWTMLAGAGAYLLRCLVFAGAVTLEGPFSLVMTSVCIGQALHGFCFGCFLAVAYMYVDRVSPLDVRGSMQSFYGVFIIGLGFFIGGFVSGAIGDAFTTQAGTETVRSQFGIASETGMVSLLSEENGVQTEMVRDWVGLWLAGAAMAAVAFIGFALLFPKETPAEAETQEPPPL